VRRYWRELLDRISFRREKSAKAAPVMPEHNDDNPANDPFGIASRKKS
jgi:hypothetical protein